jgi:hypothetical protein
VRDQAEVFNSAIEKDGEELTKIFKTKDEMREDHYKTMYEYEIQNDRIRYIKGMINAQKRMKMVVNDKAERIVMKKTELENRPNPNLREVETCEQLIQYCNRLKGQYGLIPPTADEVAEKTQKEEINKFNQ